MRLILTILLIGLFKADAQIVINASSPYRPFAAFSCGDTTRLLDSYTGAAAAYSLRRLRAAYTGAAIRVRKDTTGQPEQDVFFDLCGNLDTASLKTFLNARNGFVVTWYDQSGNGRDAVQATQVNQPRIANLGVIERRSGKVTVFFDGATDRLGTTAFSYNDGNYAAFACSNQSDTTVGNFRTMLSQDSNATGRRAPLYIRFNGPAQTWANTTGTTTFIIDNGNSININQTYVFSALKRSNNTEMYVNGATNGATTLSANSVNFSQSLKIGSQFFNGTNHYVGYIHEIILYGSDKSSDRSGIETNINTYYSVY